MYTPFDAAHEDYYLSVYDKTCENWLNYNHTFFHKENPKNLRFQLYYL